MGLLPKNQPKKTIDTPRNFFIWGQTMHGKSYLASQFPNPVIFNTDGNADQIETPSINLKNERDAKTGQISFSVINQLNELIKELETTEHGFETVVIDVIDDVVTLIEQAICEEHGVQYIGDIPYGKGFGIFKSIFTALVVKLKALPMNVIYISRYATVTENNIEKPVPSLSVKHLNTVNGNCDMNILCQKIGKNYIRRAVDRRKAYQREWIQDERILAILDTVIGAFDKPTQTSKEEAKKIVEQLEKQEEQAMQASEAEQAPKPRTAAPRPPRVK
ncbi:AAA family ATPase [Anoxybacteroides amylolyticum]|uniref:AAA domain protein n=1 Tax=Anoxybacteroides amylolyticum TaxID=294699 RepID=A0A160F6F3_9BACL|nr:AAA family ATPase [Anoxybacillus amylolyticus]ANB62168.1 AAA domain protein [Anoxybacillus amylolyticus]